MTFKMTRPGKGRLVSSNPYAFDDPEPEPKHRASSLLDLKAAVEEAPESALRDPVHPFEIRQRLVEVPSIAPMEAPSFTDPVVLPSETEPVQVISDYVTQAIYDLEEKLEETNRVPAPGARPVWIEDRQGNMRLTVLTVPGPNYVAPPAKPGRTMCELGRPLRDHARKCAPSCDFQ